MHTHVGAYAPLGELLSEMHRDQVPKQGLAVDYDRPFMAIYLNDPLHDARSASAHRAVHSGAAAQGHATGEDTVWRG